MLLSIGDIVAMAIIVVFVVSICLLALKAFEVSTEDSD